ncbi:YceI family protein [Nostoc ellipsosporum NOK]|jgi:polyisoprenoid-binding protein YceI|nr:YceI family protein [Nostoc ellipsosporum NOK]
MAKTTWNLDPTHSELQFKVKHLMVTNVTGNIPAISGTVESSDDSFSDAVVSFTADVNSITTNNEQRDGHLKGADFFETEKYPNITFKSSSYNAADGKITGDLTIRDVTKPVTLDVDFGGTAKDPWGNEKAGFSLTGKINRKDFGLTWNASLETGGVLVSEEVKLSAELQFVKAAS